MSNEFEVGQEVSFHVIPGTGDPVTGTVIDIVEPGESYYDGGDVIINAGGTTYTQPLWTLKITEGQHATIAGLKEDAERRFAEGDRGALAHSTAHNPADPAFRLLLDDFTSEHAPGVQEIGLERGCYICQDPEFAQMGLPLCRKCPECVRQGRGPGHIPADDSVCDECGHEETPADYPQPEPVPPYTAKAEATSTPPGEPYSPATDLVDIPAQAVGDKGAVITVPGDCTVQGVMIWDSSDPPRPVYWVHIGKALRAGDQVRVPGTFDVTAS